MTQCHFEITRLAVLNFKPRFELSDLLRVNHQAAAIARQRQMLAGGGARSRPLSRLLDPTIAPGGYEYMRSLQVAQAAQAAQVSGCPEPLYSAFVSSGMPSSRP